MASILRVLGVYHFRQIAAFGPADLARVNAELKEFKGRIEHDDWIGQAKELHFKKYGGTDEESSSVWRTVSISVSSIDQNRSASGLDSHPCASCLLNLD